MEDALARLLELRLISAGSDRYTVASAGLRRVLARLLPHGEEPRRAAAFFAGAAALHIGDMAWLEQEWDNLLAAARTAQMEGQAAQAGLLARAVQPHMVLNGLWDGWNQVIELAQQAAEASGDTALRAWALHERGTRTGLLGDPATAATDLVEARRLRLELGDQAGAAATQHNLDYLRLLPSSPPRSPSTPTVPLAPRRISTMLWGVAALVILLGIGGLGVGLARAGIIGWPIGGVAILPTATPLPTATATPVPRITPIPLPSITPMPLPRITPMPLPRITPITLPPITPIRIATATPTPSRTSLVVLTSADLETTLDQFSESYRRAETGVELRVEAQQPGPLLESLSADLQADVLVGNAVVMKTAVDRGLVAQEDVQPLGCRVAPGAPTLLALPTTYIAPTHSTARRDLALAYIASLLSQLQQNCPTPSPSATPSPTQTARSPGPVMAFYYPWYELSDWASGKMSDTPDPLYSGGEDDAMPRQIQQADDAGIDRLTRERIDRYRGITP